MEHDLPPGAPRHRGASERVELGHERGHPAKAPTVQLAKGLESLRYPLLLDDAVLRSELAAEAALDPADRAPQRRRARRKVLVVGRGQLGPRGACDDAVRTGAGSASITPARSEMPLRSTNRGPGRVSHPRSAVTTSVRAVGRAHHVQVVGIQEAGARVLEPGHAGEPVLLQGQPAEQALVAEDEHEAGRAVHRGLEPPGAQEGRRQRRPVDERVPRLTVRGEGVDNLHVDAFDVLVRSRVSSHQ